MSEAIVKLFQTGGGEFVSPPSVFIDKLKKVKAIVFDWDGVFNDGFKKGGDGSIFSEVDAMGTNLLRYALWKKNGALPITAIVTGEINPPAQALAMREHFHDVHFLSKHKAAVFNTFCEKHRLKLEEVLFFFDDVLDLEAAKLSGSRVMMGSKSSLMLNKYVRDNSLADYITANDGGRHGLREGCELVIGLLGFYETVAKERSHFTPDYQTYLKARQAVETAIVQPNS